jgi:hypothetical protein
MKTSLMSQTSRFDEAKREVLDDAINEMILNADIEESDAAASLARDLRAVDPSASLVELLDVIGFFTCPESTNKRVYNRAILKRSLRRYISESTIASEILRDIESLVGEREKGSGSRE